MAGVSSGVRLSRLGLHTPPAVPSLVHADERQPVAGGECTCLLDRASYQYLPALPKRVLASMLTDVVPGSDLVIATWF